MDSTDLARLQSIADRASGLRRTFAQLQAAWPDGAEFSGTDSTGALTVTMSARGDVVQVRLAADWDRRIDERSLARAVNEAIGAATIPLANQWLGEVALEPGADVPSVSHRPRPTLAEYRSRVPAPRSLEDLQPRFDLAAAARAEYARSKAQLERLAAREMFESPRGLFRVIRSRANLLGLQAEPGALAFVSHGDIERDIVASLDEIRRRDADDQAELSASLPALAALRAAETGR